MAIVKRTPPPAHHPPVRYVMIVREYVYALYSFLGVGPRGFLCLFSGGGGFRLETVGIEPKIDFISKRTPRVVH